MNIHQIAILNRGKVKKTEAARLILELAEQYPDAVPKLGLLLALHQPPAPKADTPFAWVAKAVAVKDLRSYLQYVMCDGVSMVATDGIVMHVVPCDGREPGLYDPKTGERVWLLAHHYAEGETPSGHPGRFPDWRRVCPVVSNRQLQDVASTSLRHGMLGKDPIVQGPNLSAVKQSQWCAVTLRCNRVAWGETAHVESIYLEGPNGEQAVMMPYRKNALEKAGIPV
jgi:hypothetical protein